MVLRTCARCERTGGSKVIHVHHKDGNHENNLLENLIPLCTPCHAQWHRGHWKYEECGLENVHLPKPPFKAESDIPNPSPIYLGIRIMEYPYNTIVSMIRTPKEVTGDFALYLYDDGSFMYKPVDRPRQFIDKSLVKQGEKSG